MADDIEALLDAPLLKKDEPIRTGAAEAVQRFKEQSNEQKASPRDESGSGDRSEERRRSRDRSRDRDRRRDRSRDRRRSRSRSRSRSRRSRRRSRSRSRSPRYRRSRRRSYSYSRSRSRSRDRRRRRSRSPPRRSGHDDRENIRRAGPPMSEAERDARTIVVVQLARNVTPRDIRDFFEKGTDGIVRDVRMVSDRNSRRSKGIAYVEFVEVESVEKAHSISGQRLLGVPIMVMQTEGEKNRMAEQKAKEETYISTRITVSNLPAGVTDDQLSLLFRSFGRIKEAQVFQGATNSSSSHGFVVFDKAIQAKVAVDRMNGFSIADNKIAVMLASAQGANPMAMSMMGVQSSAPPPAREPPRAAVRPSVDAAMVQTCFLQLKHMFKPENETEEDWDLDIRDEVLEECSKQGPIYHIYVDKTDKAGCVYLKFQTSTGASNAQRALNGRFFAGQQIAANFMQEPAYYTRFPQARNMVTVLQPES